MARLRSRGQHTHPKPRPKGAYTLRNGSSFARVRSSASRRNGFGRYASAVTGPLLARSYPEHRTTGSPGFFERSAAITSEGLLGSSFIGMTPGGASTPLKDGDTITDTQGAMDLMALVGQFINKGGSGASSGSTPPAAAGNTAGAGPTP